MKKQTMLFGLALVITILTILVIMSGAPAWAIGAVYMPIWVVIIGLGVTKKKVLDEEV